MTEIIQGSPEWLALRVGKVTASRVSDVVAKTKSGPSASRATYMGDLIAERLTGVPAVKYTNAAMDWGTATESEARTAYSFYHDADVAQVGFIDHPTILMTGASPDGMVGDAGLVEIKCPNTATHIETLRTRAIPSKYRTQMMWQMACTGRQWCDFASYDPRMPETMRLFTRRVERCETTIAELEKEVRAFLAELDSTVAELLTAYDLPGTLKASVAA